MTRKLLDDGQTTSGLYLDDKPHGLDVCGLLMEYEAGTLDDDRTLDLFAGLVQTGMAWTLQGSYGRTAMAMIREGWLSKTGEIKRTVHEGVRRDARRAGRHVVGQADAEGVGR